MPLSKYRYLINKKDRLTVVEREAERFGVIVEEFRTWLKVERAKDAWLREHANSPQGEV